MMYLAWAWSVLMLLGALAVRTQGWPAPEGLDTGMIVAGVVTLPLLWGASGLFAEISPPGKARASIAIVALLVCVTAGTAYGPAAWLHPPVV